MAYVNLMARRVRTARMFTAKDPWNRGRPTTFSVEIYATAPGHVRQSPAWREGTSQTLTLGGVPRYGIRSGIDGVERMIPAFLSDLYVNGSVPVERLPEALHCLGNDLAQKDFRPLPAPGLLPLMAVALIVMAIGVIGGLASSFAGSFTSKGPLGRQRNVSLPTKLEAQAWDHTRTSPGQAFIVVGSHTIEGRQPAPAELRIPDSVAQLSGRNWSLGWIRVGDGQRLVLLPERGSQNDDGVYLGYVLMQSPEELGLTSTVLALEARMPKLDITSVACSNWLIPLGRQARDTSRVAFLIAAALGAALTLCLGIVWLAGLPRRRRNHAFQHRVLSALAEARAGW